MYFFIEIISEKCMQESFYKWFKQIWFTCVSQMRVNLWQCMLLNYIQYNYGISVVLWKRQCCIFVFMGYYEKYSNFRVACSSVEQNKLGTLDKCLMAMEKVVKVRYVSTIWMFSEHFILFQSVLVWWRDVVFCVCLFVVKVCTREHKEQKQ